MLPTLLIADWLHIYIASTVFVFGAIIGSFLNVVIYRLHTGKSLSGNSHCMSCLRELRWFELFPLISYVALTGKCRTCRSYIPPRYFVVELLTALVFLGVYFRGGSIEEMFFSGALLTVLIVIAVYDIYHYIIPNELVGLSIFIALGYLGMKLFTGAPLSVVVSASFSALGAFTFFGGLWKISHGRWLGLGDAKLAAPLGFVAGFPAVFSMIVLSFWVGAVISLVIVGTQQLLNRGQIPLRFFGAPLTMKSEVPFAPFLIVGFILSHLYAVDVLELISHVL